MIEQRFRKGARYLWNKPHDAMGPMNGNIVPSVGAVSPLTYDGLDGHPGILDPLFFGGNPGAVLGGIVKGANVPYTWLDYAPGRTAWVPVVGNDVLTGYMSGCLIIRGTYGGVMSPFHVGTVDAYPTENRNVKQQLARELPHDATGFNPAAAWTHGEMAAIQANLGGVNFATPKVFAIVTTAGTFYSLALCNVSDESGAWVNAANRRYWCVGGIKQVPPTNRVKLMASLL
jgi:hypothetical protein